MIELPVDAHTSSGWTRAATADVSRTGLFLQVPPGIETSPILQLRLHVPDGEPLVVLGRVTRYVGGVLSPGETPGLGIELMSMAKAFRDRWEAYIRSISARSPSMARVAQAPSTRRSSAGGEADSILPDTARARPQLRDVGRDPPARRMSAPPRRALAPVAPVARPAAAPPRGGRVAFQDDIGVGRPSPPPLGGAGAIPETSFAASAAPAQGARPKLAGSGLLDAAPHGDETVLRVRPANRTRLAALVERRLQAGEIYLRPDVDVHEGQDVILVLVHHQTDAELALTARVERVVPGRSGARSGVLLAFEPVTPTIERDLLQFVDEGLPTAIVHQGEVARAESDARVAALQAAADERPEDARRWIRLGWALLLANRAAEATTPLQRGMALAPRMPIVPMLLLLAHGLAGDVEGAEALLGGMGADDLLEPLLD